MKILVAALALLALGCTDEIGKDTDPPTIRAALCLRVKRPPVHRCEAAAKAAALEVVRERPTQANMWVGYSIECQEPLQAAARFAPGSPEQEQLKTACCTIPDEQMRKTLDQYCPPRSTNSK